MSAIKTHQVFNIVDGDDIVFENDDGEHRYKVKSLMVERQFPSKCQIFAEKENVGSLARGTKCWMAKVETIKPETSSTEFSVKTKINNDFYTLQLKTVRVDTSECVIC